MRRSRSAIAFAAAVAALSCAACETFHGPPEVTIAGEKDKRLPDAHAPLRVVFSKPIDPGSLALEVAYFDHDIEGNLPDEQTPPSPLRTIFTHDKDPAVPETGGTSQLSADATTLTIDLLAAPPVGPEFVLIVEPGLSDEDGHATHVRTKVPFGYAFECTGTTGTTLFPPFGYYFFLANVDEPIQTQVRLWGAMKVDQATGSFIGQFTAGFRDRTPTRCDPPCDDTEACRVYPGPPACVIPSTKAGSVDEFRDFVPNPDPPIGYSFTITGCAEDQGPDSAAWANASVDVQTTSPSVGLKGVSMNAGFVLGDDGVLRGTGSFAADQVYLGPVASGSASGSETARSVAEDEIPPGIPLPEGDPPKIGGADE